MNNSAFDFQFCELKNTAAFIQDLDRSMWIYNKFSSLSMFNLSPLEVYHGENTINIFLNQYSNENVVKKNGDKARNN